MWMDMKQRLDKEDNDRPTGPPIFKGCLGYALLFSIILITIFIFLKPLTWFQNTEADKGEQPGKNDSRRSQQKEISKSTGKIFAPKPGIERSEGDSILEKNSTATSKRNLAVTIDSSKRMNTKSGDQLKHPPGQEKRITHLLNVLEKKGIQYNHMGSVKRRPSGKQLVKKQEDNLENSNSIKSQIPAADTSDDNLLGKDYSNERSPMNDTTPSHDTSQVAKQINDAVIKASDTIPVLNQTKKDSTNNKKIYFSAGLGLHQLVPVAGQKTNPYNSQGRKGSLGDYIPSAYLRLNKDKKWFLQAEFRYGAPQYSRDILFFQQKIIDTGNAVIITNNKTLKKTFYHQLPVSFNYTVLPGLSIGAGVSVNKFTSAIIQQEQYRSGITAPVDSLVSLAINSQKKRDTNFVNIYMQGFFEAQYQWKRLSGGLRYSFGLSSYLKFSLPGGQQKKESNRSLQLFIRYELWRR